MALTLEDAVQRRRLEEALSHLDTGAVSLDIAPPEDSTPSPEEVPSGVDYPAAESGPKIKEPKKTKGEYGDWGKYTEIGQIPEGHIDLAPPGPIPTPESSLGPDLQTDPETGTRYVTDPTVQGGMVPFAEPATEADKEAFKPSDVTLPKVVSEATAPPPRVARAELVNPDPNVEVRRAALAGQIPRAQPAVLPTGLKAPGAHTELAPPGQMDLRPEEDVSAETSTKPKLEVSAETSRKLPPAAKSPFDDWGVGLTLNGAPWGSGESTSTTPAGTAVPMNSPSGKPPAALIIHHTSGRGDAASVVEDWRTHRPGVGAQMIMDRDGTIHYTQQEFGYGGTGNFLHSIVPGVSNQTAVGIEVIAKDDADMTPAQLESLKKLAGPGGPYANVAVYGHSQVSPGDRDNEGVRGVNAINEARKAGGEGEVNVGDSFMVLQKLADSGLNATHFGYRGDPNLDPASARGEGAYVKEMIPGFDVALNAQAAAKVGNPNPGETFQYAGRTWRYGDKVPEIYKDARFDIFDKNNTIFTGGQLGQSATQVAQDEVTSWGNFTPVSTNELSAAAQARSAAEQTIVNSLLDKYKKTSNLASVYQDIDNNTDIAPELRARFKGMIQKEMTESMIEYDPDLKKLSETDPEKAKMLAWAKWHNSKGELIPTSAGTMNPGEGINADSLKDLWSKIQGAHIDFTNNLQNPIFSEQQVLRRFFQAIDTSPGPRQKVISFNDPEQAKKIEDLLNTIHSMPKDQQYDYINKMLPQDTGVANVPYASEVIQALDHLGNPEWMQKMTDRRNKDIKDAATKLAGDPRMRDTLGGSIGDTAAMLTEMGEAGLIGGDEAPLGFLMAASNGEHKKLKSEHPDWSEEQVNREAVKGSFISAYGPILGLRLFSNIAAPILGKIGNPVARRLANALTSAVGTGGAIGGTSILGNVVQNQPIDLEEAKRQALQGGAIGFVGGLMHLPSTRESIEPTPAPAPTPGVTEHPQLEHVPITEPHFEVLPPEENPSGQPALKQGRVWEQVLPEHTLEDRGPVSIDNADSNGNIAEVNARNEQTAKRAAEPGAAEQLLLGDREGARPAGGEELETSPILGRTKKAEKATAPAGAGTGDVTETRPDAFGPPGRKATTPDEALAQIKGYFDEHLKIIKAMGWEHEPGDEPYVHIRPDGHTIFVAGSPEAYFNYAKEHGIKDPASLVDYARKGMDEEITHALDYHSMRDEYDARKAAGTLSDPNINFHRWATREARGAAQEIFQAHDDAVAAGNHRLARTIREAVKNSEMLYHGTKLDFNGLRNHIDEMMKIDPRYARETLFSMRMEIGRQLDQAARRREVTETELPAWKKMAKAISLTITRLINSLKRAHAAAIGGELGPLMQKHLQGLINKRRSMEAIVHGEKPPSDTAGAFNRPGDEAPPVGMARPRSPTRDPTWWEKQKTKFSTTFKGGESFGLDHPTTHAIARALRRIPSHRQNIIQFAGIPELQRALGSIRLGEHGRIGKEFSDWFQARDRKLPTPVLSPKAQRLVDATVHTLNKMGDLAQRMGIKVTDGKGNVHPFTMIKDYFPRIISRDTEQIFEQRNGARAADFNRLYLDAMHKGVVKSKDEFIQKFERATMPEVTSNAFFANAEHSRQMHLPLEMHDWSPTALMRYVSRMTDRLAEIKGVGQKLNPSTHDLFDLTEQKIADDRTLSRSEKQMMATRVNQIRQAIYRKEFVDNLAGPVGKTRNVVTTTALGNWFTSANNAIGGAISNIGFGGPSSALRAYGKVLFNSILKKASAIKEGEDRGIMGHNLHDMSDDFEKVSSAGWLTKGQRGYNRFMMRWGGQNATEAVNRTVGMEQAKYLLAKYQQWGAPGAQTGFAGARARHMEDFFRRRGFSDIEMQRLYQEGGDPNKPLGQEFIRQYVMDTHGNYSPGQTASHLFDSPWGKILLQFQKFSANQWRMNTREYVLPMARATKGLVKNTPEAYGDFGYQFLRNIGHFGFLVPAGGMLISGAINAMRGRKDVTPSFAQIGKEAAKGNYGQVFHDYIQKVWQAFQLAGMTGPIGNYVGLGMTAFGFTHDKLKNPLAPPMYSIVVQPLVEYLQGVIQEGGNFADPALLSRLADNVSALRVAGNIAGTVENKLGVDDPWLHLGRKNALRNDSIFLSSRLRMYEDAHPELKKQNPPPMVRNDFSSYRDDIQNGLRYGDPALAVHAITTYLAKFPPAEANARLKKIQDSVNSSTPIKPGGQYSLEHQLEFLRWVKETQSPEDARAIFNVAQTYAQSAVATHFLASPTAQAIAKLDFNKLSPPPKAPNTTQSAQAARAGAQLLFEMKKREAALKLRRR